MVADRHSSRLFCNDARIIRGRPQKARCLPKRARNHRAAFRVARVTLEGMTDADFRRLALKLPDTRAGSHFGVEDFRVGGKIFATLAYRKEGCGVLLLTPEQQMGMIEDAPEIFSPVPNKWGAHGATLVRLSTAPADVLEGALRTAWTNRQAKAPKPRVPRARKP